MNCHSCENIPNDVIDKKYCKAYTPQQIYNCQEKDEIETFVVNKPKNVAYEVKLDNNNSTADQVYEYHYNNTNKKYVDHTTDILPILYVAGEPVLFTDVKTRQNYHFDQNTNSLIKYGTPDKLTESTMVKSTLDYANPMNVKTRLFDSRFTTTTRPTTTTTTKSPTTTTGVNTLLQCKKMVADDLIMEEEQYEEKLPQTTIKPLSANNIKLMDTLEHTGLNKSFILSFIHEMGSKEMKVKYIDDTEDVLTNNEIDTLRKLNDPVNNNNNNNNGDNDNDIDIDIDEEEYKNNLEVIQDENISITIDNTHTHLHSHDSTNNTDAYETVPPAITTKSTPMELTTKKPCAIIRQRNCSYGSTIKYKDKCPYVECNKPPNNSIMKYNLDLSTRILLYLLTLSMISLFVLFLRYNRVN